MTRKPRKRIVVALDQPEGLQAARFKIGGDEYAVLSYPAAASVPPPALSPSEQNVYAALLAGQSNAQIANERERSLRTVANQVAMIFAKLGVNSRAELAAGQFAAPRARRASRNDLAAKRR